MPFASLTDVNVHLPIDKAQAQDAEIPDLVIDAERLIRARLASIVEYSIMSAWDVEALPTSTCPELIREITGKLVAAKFYANLVAEDEADGSEFAQTLYNDAINMLNELREGTLTLIDVDGLEVTTSNLDVTDFWPNNTTQESFFKVADQWA